MMGGVVVKLNEKPLHSSEMEGGDAPLLQGLLCFFLFLIHHECKNILSCTWTVFTRVVGLSSRAASRAASASL